MAKDGKSSKGKKWIIIIPLVLILAIGGGIGGDMLANKLLNKPKVAKQVDTGGIASGEKIVPMDKFLVNLADDGSSQKYISLNISLVVSSKKAKQLKKNTALVRDSVINILRQKKESDILANANSVPSLKTELINNINQNYGQKIVEQIFITNLVIQ
ncbi:flagellar basal body-associated FliL family protein [Liquorilactobacillus ghanensis]|uniref:flagellar basal body-associated FliL family protein n=1 Tax=Liquorilactobacillus ghanensis TaxID=399370 RepID=UPI0039E81D37